ncbi:MAG: hypothetical protein MUE44_21685 [Oscillatoriaceae cyanobacterium Prado104]|nr:hypothetical protein [Oscillatoriaceae cyanobacterium Prado104]
MLPAPLCITFDYCTKKLSEHEVAIAPNAVFSGIAERKKLQNNGSRSD